MVPVPFSVMFRMAPAKVPAFRVKGNAVHRTNRHRLATHHESEVPRRIVLVRIRVGRERIGARR